MLRALHRVRHALLVLSCCELILVLLRLGNKASTKGTGEDVRNISYLQIQLLCVRLPA